MNNPGDTWTEGLTVFDHPTQGHAGHVHTVIGPLARNKTLALPLTARIVIGVSDFHCCIDGFRPGVGKKDMVESIGGQFCNPSSEFKGQGLSQLKGRHVGRGLKLVVHGLSNLGPAVAGSAAKKS